jgi:hypothetical protein
MEDETEELFALAESLGARANTFRDSFQELIADMRPRFGLAQNGIEREHLSEKLGRSLRHLWIDAGVSSTSRNFRSPPTEQKTRTATGRNIEFGYERDLQPSYLEKRCTTFFDVPPEGWASDHVLLSSGQSAMAAVLHSLEGGALIGSSYGLSFVHLGAYFETTEIVSLFGSLLKPVGCGRRAVAMMDDLDADVFIIEPVFCDGEFGSVDLDRVIAKHKERPRARVYIFDTTLTGSAAPVERDLVKMRPLNPPAIFRLMSGLKLHQGGLELASVGILSVFTPQDALIPAKELGNRVRKIRTLLGLGLSFADVAVLEAPWFLDREYTRLYQQAVFENNARLARHVSATNQLFRGAFHPSLLNGQQGCRDGPYCVFRLKSGDPQAYDLLEEWIRCAVRARGILFEWGGSFGFRGHRFEVVRPGDGSEPFLRVALGRRPGWSCDQITALIGELAAGQLTSLQ